MSDDDFEALLDDFEALDGRAAANRSDGARAPAAVTSHPGSSARSGTAGLATATSHDHSHHSHHSDRSHGAHHVSHGNEIPLKGDSLDDLLAEISDDEDNGGGMGLIMRAARPGARAAIAASASTGSGSGGYGSATGTNSSLLSLAPSGGGSSAAKCFPPHVGGASVERGRTVSANRPRACSSLRCTSCSHRVVEFAGEAWDPTTDYLALRLNYPDHDRLAANLVPASSGTARGAARDPFFFFFFFFLVVAVALCVWTRW